MRIIHGVAARISAARTRAFEIFPLGLIKPPSNPNAAYELFSDSAELFGWIIGVGLAVDIWRIWLLPDGWDARVIDTIADGLIFTGVAGELWCGRKARIEADRVLEETKKELLDRAGDDAFAKVMMFS